MFVHETHIYCSFSLCLCEAGNPADAGANGHVLLDSITLHRGHGGGSVPGPLVEWPGGIVI